MSAALVERVISRTGDAFGVSRADLLGRSRVFAEARMVVMYVLCEHYGWSSVEVGRVIGRDHSTANHAHRRIGLRVRANRRLARTTEWIAEQPPEQVMDAHAYFAATREMCNALDDVVARAATALRALATVNSHTRALLDDAERSLLGREAALDQRALRLMGRAS